MARGFIQLRKAIILVVTVYDNKRIKIKISKGKVHRAESKRDKSELPGCPYPEESYRQCLILPAMMCDHMLKMLPNRETHLSLSA